MRKTITVEKEKEIIFCDLCKKEIKTYTHCSICNRELCDDCSKDMKYTQSIWYPPCPGCIELKSKYFDDIQKLFKESEKLRDKGIALLHKWGKESSPKSHTKS